MFVQEAKRKQKEEEEQRKRKERDSKKDEFDRLSKAGKPNFVITKRSDSTAGEVRFLSTYFHAYLFKYLFRIATSTPLLQLPGG